MEKHADTIAVEADRCCCIQQTQRLREERLPAASQEDQSIVLQPCCLRCDKAWPPLAGARLSFSFRAIAESKLVKHAATTGFGSFQRECCDRGLCFAACSAQTSEGTSLLAKRSLPRTSAVHAFHRLLPQTFRGAFDHSNARYVWMGPEAKTSHASIEAALFELTCSRLVCGWPLMKPFRYVST